MVSFPLPKSSACARFHTAKSVSVMPVDSRMRWSCLSSAARFGPDVEWISAIDYNVDEGRHSRFFKAAQKIWPAIEAEKLVPAYCGIRPKIACESGNADFIISGPAEHGLEGLINLFGIESPGLTARSSEERP